MLYLKHKPLPPLADFVELLWLYEGYDVPHRMERLLPDGTVELVVNLREDKIRIYDSDNPERFDTIPGCVVSGPRSEFFVIDTAGEASTVGVHFKPGGAFPFLRMPATELQNQSVALECLWGRQSGRLRERLLEAATPERKLQVLEGCLLRQLTKPPDTHPALGFAIQQFRRGVPALSVSQVADSMGFSQRRFIQVFSHHIGLTPKLFSRVSRFQKVIRTAHGLEDVDWAGTALDCGYYDQAHFIHDFRSFAGITPTEYLARKTPHVNHVPMEP